MELILILPAILLICLIVKMVKCAKKDFPNETTVNATIKFFEKWN